MAETRITGHNQLVSDGLHVWTEGNTSTDKAAGYYATPGLLLNQISETSINFLSYTGGRPSVQLGVDRDGNGSWDGYLVYEPWAYGDGQYWVNKPGFGVAAGGGYMSMGTLAEYQAANPDARVMSIGYSLGSGLKGDAVIKNVTIGNTVYTFGLDYDAALAMNFTRCDAFEIRASNLAGHTAKLSWQTGYTGWNIDNANKVWGSGFNKWTSWFKAQIYDSAGRLVYTKEIQSPCKNGEGYWAGDYKTFGVRGVQGYPDNYSVKIMWDGGQNTTKSMKDVTQYGWWSSGDRSKVTSFRYQIIDTTGVVRYTSPDYDVDRVAPVVDAGEAMVVTDALTVDLEGSSDDETATYIWQLVDGPGTATFDDETQLETAVTVDVYGDYVFRLIGRDAIGNEGVSEVMVAFKSVKPVDPTPVNPSTPANQPPAPASPAVPQIVPVTAIVGTTGSPLANAILNNQSVAEAPRVLAAEDNQQKTKIRDIADTMAAVAGDKTKATWWQSLIGWWWLPLVIIAAGFLWWLLAAARRRRDDDV